MAANEHTIQPLQPENKGGKVAALRDRAAKWVSKILFADGPRVDSNSAAAAETARGAEAIAKAEAAADAPLPVHGLQKGGLPRVVSDQVIGSPAWRAEIRTSNEPQQVTNTPAEQAAVVGTPE